MKKFIKYFLIIMTIITLTGCKLTLYKSPENVSKEMVKRLSQGKYTKIYDLINTDEKFYQDDDVLLKYITDNKLDIEGNKSNKISSANIDGDKAKVKIEIDGNKLLVLNLVKKDKKWLVDIDDQLSKNFTITVAKGSVVKLNDKILDKDKYCTDFNGTASTGYDSKRIETPTVYDSYNIPSLMKTEYTIKIENKNITTKEEIINTDSGKLYALDANDEITKAARDFTTKYYQDVIDAINKKADFSTIKHYFDGDADFMTSIEKQYNKYKNTTIISDIPYNYKPTDYSLISMKYDCKSCNVSYYGDGIILSVGAMTYKYKQVYSYFDLDDKDYSLAVLHLIKKNDTFVIVNGIYAIPEFY